MTLRSIDRQTPMGWDLTRPWPQGPAAEALGGAERGVFSAPFLTCLSELEEDIGPSAFPVDLSTPCLAPADISIQCFGARNRSASQPRLGASEEQ